MPPARPRRAPNHFAPAGAGGIATLRLSGDGRIAWASADFCALLGYDAAELAGMPLGELVHPDDPVPGEVAAALGEVRVVRVFRKDGRGLRLNVTGPHDGHPDDGLLHTHVADDPGEQEALLVQLDDHFRERSDPAGAILWAGDRQGRVTFLGAGWQDLAGQRIRDALGSGWSRAIHRADREQARRTWRDAVRAGTPFHFECRIGSPTMGYRRASLAGRPRGDPDGEASGYVGSVVDVHDARERDADRHDREERLTRMDAFRRSLLDLVGEALTAHDDTFHRHLVERAVAVIPGVQAGALLLRGDGDAYRFAATAGYDLKGLRHVRFPARVAGFDHPADDPEPRIVVRPRGTPPELGRDAAAALLRHGREDQIASVLVLPIVVEDRIAAFLTLDNFEREDVFGDEAVEMGRIFAGQAAGLLRRFELEGQLHRLAFRDPLTDLPNRAHFKTLLNGFLADAREPSLAVLFIDLDNLKPINDSFGHAAGDGALREVAARLRSWEEDGHAVARLGGDEFTLAARVAATEAEQIGRALLSAIGRPIEVEGHQVHLSASIGIALHPEHGTDPEDLLRRADVAMYHAKTQGGKSAVATFSPAMEAVPLERLLLDSALRAALDRDEFVLHFQPRVSRRSGRIRSVEALVRWLHPDRGLVPPGLFVPLAESTSLIHPLGRYVLETAARQAKRWRDAGHADLRVSVNLSARQLERDDFVAEVVEVLGEVGLPAAALEFEVLERAAMIDVAATAERLAELRALGARIALDDFGMGYSSLAYLRELPVDTIKIDRNFLTGLGRNDPNRAIVGAINLLGQALGHVVVAEGVETLDQWDALGEIGVDEVQGYLLARPASADVVGGLLRGGVLLPPERGD